MLISLIDIIMTINISLKWNCLHRKPCLYHVLDRELFHCLLVSSMKIMFMNHIVAVMHILMIHECLVIFIILGGLQG